MIYHENNVSGLFAWCYAKTVVCENAIVSRIHMEGHMNEHQTALAVEVAGQIGATFGPKSRRNDDEDFAQSALVGMLEDWPPPAGVSLRAFFGKAGRAAAMDTLKHEFRECRTPIKEVVSYDQIPRGFF